MKNVQLIVLIIFINSLYSTVSAQNKKWEVGIAITTTFYKLDQKPTTIIRAGNTETNMTIIGLDVSRTILPQIDIGTGIGFSTLSYQIGVGKTTHQLDAFFQYTNRPDFSKKPYLLNSVRYDNYYLTVPFIVKYRVFKNSEKIFQPSIGLRIDNFFLRANTVRGGYTGGDSIGDLFADFFNSIFSGQVSGESEWDTLTSSQRQETSQYFEEQVVSFTMNISPSLRLNWHIKKVAFGIEPFFNIVTKKVNKLLKGQDGGGVRTYFSVRF